MINNFHPQTATQLVLSTLTFYSQQPNRNRQVPIPGPESIQYLVRAVIAISQGRDIPPVPQQLGLPLVRDVGYLVRELANALRFVEAFQRDQVRMYQEALNMAIGLELEIIDQVDRARPMFAQ